MHFNYNYVSLTFSKGIKITKLITTTILNVIIITFTFTITIVFAPQQQLPLQLPLHL